MGIENPKPSLVFLDINDVEVWWLLLPCKSGNLIFASIVIQTTI